MDRPLAKRAAMFQDFYSNHPKEPELTVQYDNGPVLCNFVRLIFKLRIVQRTVWSCNFCKGSDVDDDSDDASDGNDEDHKWKVGLR